MVELVRNKQEALALYQAFQFGNRLKSWSSLREWMESFDLHSAYFDYNSKFGVMYKPPTIGEGKRWFKTNLSYKETLDYYTQIKLEGAIADYIQISEALPGDKLIIQGELMRWINGYELTYTTEPNTVNRPATWPEMKTATGITAKLILEHYLWPKSYEALISLFDRWPDACIEFSTCSCELGELPGHNTVVWEVRNY